MTSLAWIITGYSGKLDGFIFTCTAENEAEALARLLERYEGDKIFDFTDPYDHSPVRYLLSANSEWKPDFGNYDPRREGWQIHVSKVDELGFANNAVCW